MTIVVSQGELERAFAPMLNATNNTHDVLDIIGADLAEASRLSIAEGHDPWGAVYAPLAIRDGEPLRDTGLLANSITYDVRASGVAVGTDRDGAATHQFGATIEPVDSPLLAFNVRGFDHPFFARKVTIPRRAFLPIDEQGEVDLPETWTADIVEELSRHFAPPER